MMTNQLFLKQEFIIIKIKYNLKIKHIFNI